MTEAIRKTSIKNALIKESQDLFDLIVELARFVADPNFRESAEIKEIQSQLNSANSIESDLIVLMKVLYRADEDRHVHILRFGLVEVNRIRRRLLERLKVEEVS